MSKSARVERTSEKLDKAEYKRILSFLRIKPGYCKKSVEYLQGLFDTSKVTEIIRARETVRNEVYPYISKSNKSLNIAYKKVSSQVASKALEVVEKPFRRLYFDIETSPNVVFSWNVGYKLNIPHENIIKERAIICICWKWENEKEVHSLSWNKGDDKQMMKDFAKVLNSADEVIGHNSDNFDIKWFRTRCLLHNIDVLPDIQSIDTLKLSRKGFRFNSNKLDYIAKFLGFGGKLSTGGFQLWLDIITNNNPKSMDLMVEYCQKDVVLLEKVYNRIKNYTTHKTHRGVFNGGLRCDCPECSGSNTTFNGFRITSTGIRKRRMKCTDCGKHFTISEKAYQEKA